MPTHMTCARIGQNRSTPLRRGYAGFGLPLNKPFTQFIMTKHECSAALLKKAPIVSILKELQEENWRSTADQLPGPGRDVVPLRRSCDQEGGSAGHSPQLRPAGIG